MSIIGRFEGLLRGTFSEERSPLKLPVDARIWILTESHAFDTMHRRAGRDERPKKENPHADAHKYCPLGRCGTRPGAYAKGPSSFADRQNRTSKITAWRKAKAQANRRYLEEHVYAKPKADAVV